MGLWVLTVTSGEGGVIDCYPEGSPSGYKFHKAIPLAASFPSDAAVRFSRNFPNWRKLEDFQPNTLGALIISSKVRRVLDGLGVTNAEYLPVAVRDHEGNLVDPQYAVLNLIGTVDAIDLKQSRYEMDHIAQDQIAYVHELVLDNAAIPPQAKIFRCTARRRLFLIRDDVRAAFEAAALTGYRLFAAEGWNGKDY